MDYKVAAHGEKVERVWVDGLEYVPADAIRKVRDGYADQAKFADVDAASYFREFVRRIDASLAPGKGRQEIIDALVAALEHAVEASDVESDRRIYRAALALARGGK